MTREEQKLKTRIVNVIFVFAIGVVAVLISLVKWQFVKGGELQKMAIAQQTAESSISSDRGTIYDRNGKILAQNSSVKTITASPNDVQNAGKVDETAKTLAQILGLDEQKVKEQLSKKLDHVEIKKKVDLDTANLVREQNLTGVFLVDDTKRYYPYGSLAAHVIGTTGTDNQGLSGVEIVYEEYLKGKPGRLITSRNDDVNSMQYEEYERSVRGSNIVLTIDEIIQHFVESELEQACKDYKVENGAACIVMHAKTGEILAMATYPTFDLNNPFTLTDPQVLQSLEQYEGEERTKKYNEEVYKLWRNKAVVDSYEPGSTFKSITACMALEEGVVSLNEVFNCSGSMRVADTNISCWKTGGHGSETFVQGVEGSCNPLFMTLGARVGAKNFYKYYKAFGFNETTGFDLPGEASGTFHEMSNFNDVELATSSFGQTFIITPLQLITAYSAITNGGNMVRPHVVKQIVDDNGNVIKNNETEVIRQVVSEETAKTVCNILEGVVSKNTGKNAYIKGFRVAGKTGTSEKFPRGNGKYVASFIGFAPCNDPEIIGLVMLDEPMGSSHMGGATAAPAFKNIFDNVLRYLNIEPQYTEEELASLDNSVPNVEGLSKSDAIAKFANTGLKYNIIGSGSKIISQIPKGGSTLPDGSTVVLYTEDAQAQQVEVPNLIGMTASQANTALTNSGLNIKEINVAENVSNGTALVNKQEPAAGTKVNRGTVVNVQFSYTDNVH